MKTFVSSPLVFFSIVVMASTATGNPCSEKKSLPLLTQKASFTDAKPILSLLHWVTKKGTGKEPQTVRTADSQLNVTGTMAEGKYQGKSLITAQIVYRIEDAESLGEIISGTAAARFVETQDKKWVFASGMSQGDSSLIGELIKRLKERKIKMVSDPSLLISELVAPSYKEINGICFKLAETTGRPLENDISHFRPLNVQSPSPFSKLFVDGPYVVARFADGILLRYGAVEPIPKSLVSWEGKSLDRYTCDSPPGKELVLPIELVQYADVPEGELKESKKLPTLGFIYTRPTEAEKNYAEYKADYDTYHEAVKDSPDLKDNPGSDPERTAGRFTDRLLTQKEFTEKLPIIYWKDSLGRFIKCANTRLRLPSFAEPVIYIYSPAVVTVNVRLDPKVVLTASRPTLTAEGWTVQTSASLKGWVEHNEQRIPYLFWEGKSEPLGFPTRGFNVESKGMTRFLKHTLPQWGLNKREIKDFIRYWAPRLKQDHYLISFVARSTIEELAPLHFEPPPNYIHRVWMDIIPTDAPVDIEPQRPPQLTPRRGLSIVEWGAVLR